MSRCLKLVCIWCLVVVLPLQSLAAGCRLACAGPHAAIDAVLADAGPAAHPCHPAAAETSADLGAVADEGAANADHRCGNCAGCCAIAALPVGTLTIGAPAAVQDRTVLPQPRPVCIVVAGLERPPRAAAH